MSKYIYEVLGSISISPHGVPWFGLKSLGKYTAHQGKPIDLNYDMKNDDN